MPAIEAIDVPEHALLRAYADGDGYADAYCVDVANAVGFADFVEAFYTTWLFKIERLLLRLVRRPSSDAQARQLAQGSREDFAAWRVEARAPRQLLMCDFMGRTRSWLMCEQRDGGSRLYFGSAVMARVDARTGRRSMGGGFSALLGLPQVVLAPAPRRCARRGRAAAGGMRSASPEMVLCVTIL